MNSPPESGDRERIANRIKETLRNSFQLGTNDSVTLLKVLDLRSEVQCDFLLSMWLVYSLGFHKDNKASPIPKIEKYI